MSEPKKGWVKSLFGKLFVRGPNSNEGPQGPQGPRGQSVYELAVELGFQGTPREFLMQLKGVQGPVGATGISGRDSAFAHEFVRHCSYGPDDDLLIVASAVALEKHRDNEIIRAKLKDLAMAVRMVDDELDIASGIEFIRRHRENSQRIKSLKHKPGLDYKYPDKMFKWP